MATNPELLTTFMICELEHCCISFRGAIAFDTILSGIRDANDNFTFWNESKIILLSKNCDAIDYSQL